MARVRFDFDGILLDQYGVRLRTVQDLHTPLQAIRDRIWGEHLDLYRSGGSIREEMQPLDAGFIEWPAKILQQYKKDPVNSLVGRVLKIARRIRDEVDRVVVLGIGGSYMGAKALMDACCEPYFNELPRGDRGGRPRMYFEGNNVDNDATQGLIRLLSRKDDSLGRSSPFAIVVISKSGGTLETAVALRQFIQAFRQTSDDERDLARLLVPVTGEQGKLASLADALQCQDRLEIPAGIGGRFSVLTPVGLLPAAILGLDIIALLEGAAELTEHFRTAAAGDNVVLDYVAANHAMEVHQQSHIRVLAVWNKSLEATGYWYDQLLSESLGKQLKGATPITMVNTRDLHSRAQQHQEGRRDKLVNNLVVDGWRCDPLPVGHIGLNQDQLDALQHYTLPEIMQAAIAGTNAAMQEDGRATTTLHLPKADEHSLGQFFQWMMLATVVEGLLIGINPYGQPGVEKYKQKMMHILHKDKGALHVH